MIASSSRSVRSRSRRQRRRSSVSYKNQIPNASNPHHELNDKSIGSGTVVSKLRGKNSKILTLMPFLNEILQCDEIMFLKIKLFGYCFYTAFYFNFEGVRLVVKIGMHCAILMSIP